ncbi:LytTR family DNA-binding domain-containing protein [Leptobacterium sp. I13]|uniref:LytTR family DNA-binding domain-containing protein n=1 Tax=Leptobacterium meishanense TaxID=3128904 RepID=UPI0030EED690
MLKKQIPFVNNWFKQTLIGILIALFLVFILLYLQPFDTFMFKHPNKTLLFLGYGACLLTTHMLLYRLEKIIYFQNHNRWTIGNEALFVIMYFLIGTLVINIYHVLVIKEVAFEWSNYGRFLFLFSLPIAIIILPFLMYLRYRTGVLPTMQEIITIEGSNKKDIFTIEKSKLLYAKSSDNYVEFHFLNSEGEVESFLMRSTLSNILKQASFLMKIHRSYLINPSYAKALSGHSQNAFLELKKGSKKLPVSKTYYKKLQGYINSP